MPNVEEELKEATKRLPMPKRFGSNDEMSGPEMLVWKANSLSDAEWDRISDATKVWLNNAIIAIKRKLPLPAFPAPTSDPLAGYTFSGLLPEEGDKPCDSPKSAT